MMNPHVVFLHGINTYRPDFADSLIENLGVQPISTQISWGHKVFTEILEYEKAYNHLRAPWYLPWSGARRKLIQFLHDSIVWVRSYDDPCVYPEVNKLVEEKVLRVKKHPEDKFVFVGHSLGSVVIIGAILQMLKNDTLNPINIHGIVTMGSPLHIWKTPNKLRDYLKSVPFTKTWVNIWDPDDPVSGKLSGFYPRIRDVEINVGWTVASHIKYWSNKKVADQIRKDCLDEQFLNSNKIRFKT